MKSVISLFFALFLSATALIAQTSVQTETEITVGQTIHSMLTSESIHAYTLELEPDHFVYGFVNQESVDVVVTIHDPKGN